MTVTPAQFGGKLEVKMGLSIQDLEGFLAEGPDADLEDLLDVLEARASGEDLPPEIAEVVDDIEEEVLLSLLGQGVSPQQFAVALAKDPGGFESWVRGQREHEPDPVFYVDNVVDMRGNPLY